MEDDKGANVHAEEDKEADVQAREDKRTNVQKEDDKGFNIHPEEDEADAIKFGSHTLFAGSAVLRLREDREDKIREEKLKAEAFMNEPVKSEDWELEHEDDIELYRQALISKDDEYPSNGAKRGICLLFENDMFHTNLGLAKRKGSAVDRAVANKVFTKLGFEVRIFRNLTSSDILRTLEDAAMEDHDNNDMFVAIMLSHGNEGILYGYDTPFPVNKMWEPFTADKCPSLAGKPKLFFLQACQGSRLDEGVPVWHGARTSSDGFASYRTPLHSDFLIAHSTVAGFYSWRNTAQGSWFVQVLGAALAVNCGRHDLVSILTKVGSVIAKEYESNSTRPEFNKKKQIPFIYSTLTAKLYLKPK